MKLRSVVLASLLALSSVSILAVSPANAQDKEQSPAKKEIYDADYLVKEVARLRNQADLATSKAAQATLEGTIADLDKTVASLKKIDPSWDTSTYEWASSDAKKALANARAGNLGPAAIPQPAGDKTKSPAFEQITAVEAMMKSIAAKTSSASWSTDSKTVAAVENELNDLDKRIGAVKKKDPSWDVKPYEGFFKERLAKWKAAKSSLEAKSKEQNEELARAAKWDSIGDRFGLSIAAGFRAVDKKPRLTIDDIKEDVDALFKLEGVVKECKDNDYARLESKYLKEKRERRPLAVCNMAAGYKELAKQYVPLAAKAHLDDRLAADNKALDALEKDGRLTPRVRENLSNASAYAEKTHFDFTNATAHAGVTVDTAYFKPLESNGKRFAAALAAAAKRSAFPATDGMIADSAATTAVKGAVAKTTKVLKVSVAKWSVNKATKDKSTYGAALLQVAGEAHCRVYGNLQFTSAYAAAGYDKPTVKGFGASAEYFVSTCE